MTKLARLIRELCPNGVDYKMLSDVLKIKNGSDYKSFPQGAIPVYGSGGIIAHIDRYAYDKPSVLIPRKGSIDKLYYVDIPFWTVDTIFYTDINTEVIEPKFVFYYLQNQHLEMLNTAGGVPSLTQKVLNKVPISVPPLEVQREIVHILDYFTELTVKIRSELTTELIARKRQYEYYRKKIVNNMTIDSTLISVAELGKWSGGKTPSMAVKEFWSDGKISWISSKDMKTSVLSDTEDHITQLAIDECPMTLYPEGSVAIVTRSGILKHTFPVAYIPFKTTVNQDIKIMVAKEGVSSKYVAHALQAYGEDIRVKTKKQGGTVDSLDFQKVLAYKIPLPTMEIQNRIVSALDNFETICSDLHSSITTEIKARQKQYEYYRDQLLMFNGGI